MNKNLIKIAEDLVKYSKSKGASEVQVRIGSSKSFIVENREQEIEKLTESGDRTLRLKVILDKKVAHASSSDLSEETLKAMADNALERAKLSSPDEFAGLPENSAIQADIKSLGLYDEAIAKLPAEKKIAIAKKVEKIAVADKRVKLCSGSYYGNSVGSTIIVNSNGFSGAYDYSQAYFGVGLQAGTDEKFFEDSWSSFALSLDKLESPEDVAQTAINRVVRLVGAKPVKTQVVPIVFDPRMAASLLSFISGCLDGSSIYMKQSFLEGKIGQKIAVDQLNIIDDALMPGKVGSSPFDSEGVPTGKTVLVENGVLKNYLLDTYSAKKLGMKSNGHASGTTNLYIDKGQYSPEDIIRSVKNGLYLTNTIGQGTDATTGTISKGAYGLWIKDGQLADPVAEITFSGNFNDMLMNMSMIGNDLVFNRSTVAPTIKIDNMDISGIK